MRFESPIEKATGLDFKNNVFKLMTGTFLSQLIVVFSLPIITRLFSPEAFGEAAIYIAIIAIFTIIACGKYEMAIPLPKSDRTAANIVLLCVSLLTIISFAVLLLVITYSILAKYFNTIPYSNYIWLVPVGIIVSGLYTIVINWNIRNKRYSRISTSKVITAFFSATSKIGFASVGISTSFILIIGQLFGSLTGIVVNVIKNPTNHTSIFKGISRYRVFGVLRRYKKFPIYNTFSSLLGVGSWRLPILLFGIFYSPYYVGLYALGFRVFQLPVNLISKSISQVFFQKIAEQKNKLNGELVESITREISGLALAPFVLILISGPELFAFVFGDDWKEAGVYAQILVPWTYVWFLTSVFTTIFIVYERQELHLQLNFINFFLRAIVIVLGGLYFKIEITLYMLSILGFFIYSHRLLITFRLSGARLLKIGKSWVYHLTYIFPIACFAYFGNENHILLLLAVCLTIVAVIYNAIHIYTASEIYDKRN
jgi:O-antigen/teichoic acid export membrane protein